jgi:hypothetical protein
LARALAWHARGPGFKSPYLHHIIDKFAQVCFNLHYMSLEISQKTIVQAYEALNDERMQDWTLVVDMAEEAVQDGRQMDDKFMQEMAEARRLKAESNTFPVDGTLATVRSSLRIVRDIMAIRAIEADSERLEGVDLRGTGDMALAGAIGREHSDRLREKGVLRILDIHTSQTMWAVEFDNPMAQRQAELKGQAQFS